MTSVLFEFDNSNLWLNITLVIFCFCVFVQLLYYWGVFSRLSFYKKRKTEFKTQNLNEHNHPVSVIICAKNEFDNLKNNLPIILQQDYPEYEVVVVDDCSDDDTYYLLKSLSDQYERLKVITLKETVSFIKGKKFPLAVGIKSAQYEHLLLTDADCYPKSSRWIYEMTKQFFYDTKGNTEIVLGYGMYARQKSFLNTLIRFDTLHIAMQYFSYTLLGIPYMGVGRNLAYTKSIFYKNKGFASIYHIKSGDDDLFINKASNFKNTTIEIIKESHTVSVPEQTFNAWLMQKKRHLSTGKFYKFKHKFLLSFFAVTQWIYYLLFIIHLVFLCNIVIIVPLFIVRTFSQMFIFKKCMKKLDEKNLLLISPLLEIIFNIFNPLFIFMSKKHTTWK